MAGVFPVNRAPSQVVGLPTISGRQLDGGPRYYPSSLLISPILGGGWMSSLELVSDAFSSSMLGGEPRTEPTSYGRIGTDFEDALSSIWSSPTELPLLDPNLLPAYTNNWGNVFQPIGRRPIYDVAEGANSSFSDTRVGVVKDATTAVNACNSITFSGGSVSVAANGSYGATVTVAGGSDTQIGEIQMEGVDTVSPCDLLNFDTNEGFTFTVTDDGSNDATVVIDPPDPSGGPGVLMESDGAGWLASVVGVNAGDVPYYDGISMNWISAAGASPLMVYGLDDAGVPILDYVRAHN